MAQIWSLTRVNDILTSYILPLHVRKRVGTHCPDTYAKHGAL